MINFDQIPGNEFWNNIEVDPYAPEFNCDYFIGKSYLDILDTLRKYPDGEYMTLSLSYIPSVVSFYFYSYCIIQHIKDKNILLKGWPFAYYFDNIIYAIEYKIKTEKIFSTEFYDFIFPLNEIITGILDGSLPSDYDEEELAEIEERTLALIAEIERRYAECIATENIPSASIPDEEGRGYD